MTAAGCTRSHRALETVALAAAAAFSLALLVRLGASAHPPGLRLAGAAAMLGYLAADLLSGFVRWILDTWGDEDTPVIGRGFIAPFRDYHRDPASITRHDFIETNGNTAIPVVASPRHSANWPFAAQRTPDRKPVVPSGVTRGSAPRAPTDRTPDRRPPARARGATRPPSGKSRPRQRVPTL